MLNFFLELNSQNLKLMNISKIAKFTQIKILQFKLNSNKTFKLTQKIFNPNSY